MKKEELDELKAYVHGVKGGVIVTEQMGYCKRCGKWQDLRFGVCFDCAMSACLRPRCPFKRLVYCGQGRKQIWKDMVYVGLQGKRYCDRDEGVCSEIDYVVALDKVSSVDKLKTETQI